LRSATISSRPLRVEDGIGLCSFADPPHGQRSFTDADLLALWRALPHDDPSWADDLEKVTRSQPTIADEPSPSEGGGVPNFVRASIFRGMLTAVEG